MVESEQTPSPKSPKLVKSEKLGIQISPQEERVVHQAEDVARVIRQYPNKKKPSSLC